ncbi:MAG: VOC family protein [Chloroflexota bacterium]
MQKITPFLWFDSQAEEAVNFYTSLFKDSKVLNVTRYGEAGPGPAGTVMTMNFQLSGQDFTALNGGPEFKFTPAISLFANCDSEEEIDRLFERLSAGGAILMELGKYPFSDKFCWINDRYGVSWQLNLASGVQKITPFLTFVGKQHGKAEEAMNLYVSLFENSSIQAIQRYGPESGESEGTVMHARFSLDGQEFMAIDGGLVHNWTFTEAVSLFVNCKTQKEVDLLWQKLTEGGEESQCGWLKDRYGVSWQIVPTALGSLIGGPDPAGAQRAVQAMLQMRKLDLAALQRAYEGG